MCSILQILEGGYYTKILLRAKRTIHMEGRRWVSRTISAIGNMPLILGFNADATRNLCEQLLLLTVVAANCVTPSKTCQKPYGTRETALPVTNLACLQTRKGKACNMADQQTKNKFMTDHDEEYPIVKTATGEIKLSASFSIAEQSVRSGERLKWLIDFIRRNNNSSTRSNDNGDSVGVTHRLAEQVVYLAYWENYPLELWLEENGGTTVILARFSRQPELTFVLDVFKDGLDPHSEIQGWWNFFCETITTHADIWQILLVIDESVYRKLNAGNYPQVQVDIVPKP